MLSRALEHIARLPSGSSVTQCERRRNSHSRYSALHRAIPFVDFLARSLRESRKVKTLEEAFIGYLEDAARAPGYRRLGIMARHHQKEGSRPARLIMPQPARNEGSSGTGTGAPVIRS